MAGTGQAGSTGQTGHAGQMAQPGQWSSFQGPTRMGPPWMASTPYGAVVQVSDPGPVGPRTARSVPQPPLESGRDPEWWRGEASRAISLSVAPGTLRAYQRAGKEFGEFRQGRGYQLSWPVPVEHLAEFCVQVRQRGLSVRTIRSRLAGLAFLSKAGGFADLSGDFRIRKMLEGWLREQAGAPGDTRQPLTVEQLSSINVVFGSLCSSLYEARLFRAAACVMFFGALRVSEAMASSQADTSLRAFQFADLAFRQGGVSLVVRRSKTDQLHRGVALQLSAATDQSVCPVAALRLYCGMRGSGQGYLFRHCDGTPLTRFQFWALVSRAMAQVGMDPAGYGTHSFRIGAASSTALSGFPAHRIREIGRWRSAAYLGYVRPAEDPRQGLG
ncbi:uncharacterized protein [Erythrolamprus reginae]|uniref:uncharacterized protein n=1 Tax=Erythrolamprus reginae TaxID=121349 RepID=UPI00396CF1E8